MRSQTEVFSKLVKEFMKLGPLTLPSQTPCVEAVSAMAEAGASCLVVVDGGRRPIGILTERDVVNRVAFIASKKTPISEVMTAPVLTIDANNYLYRAIARMRRNGLRHMPVTDRDDMLIGMLDLHDALAVASSRMIRQIERLTKRANIEGLKQIKEAQVELAEELFQDNLPAPEIQTLLTHVNNDIYAGIIDNRLEEMRLEGWGDAPIKFSVIVMGSSGRGENFLYPDQDNGFILADYPDSEHARIDRFFSELAVRMTEDLDAVGIPYCQGNCMATNPVWRKTLSQWKDQVALWARKRNPVAIRLSDIFFDFKSVWGEKTLAHQLREAVTETIQANHFFLQEMYREEADHVTALGLFNRFKTEKDDIDHKGQINFKHMGTVPLVETIRLLALREGVLETSTIERMKALSKLDVLDKNELEFLSRAFTLITRILLRHQLRDYRDGRVVSNFVFPRDMSRLERQLLVQAFQAIDDLRKRVKSEFTAEVF